MSILVLLIVASLAIATAFLVCFIWAVRSGQYEDTCTPSLRLLAEDAKFDGLRAGGPSRRVTGSLLSSSSSPESMDVETTPISAKPDPRDPNSLNPL